VLLNCVGLEMKAAVYYGLNDIRVEDVPKPKPKPEEIVVEMKACGVCGSDLMEWYLRSRVPLVLGHEPAGVVAAIGGKVEAFTVGDRVFVHHHVACLTCYYCIRGDYTMCERFGRTHIHPGGFAEYFRVPAENLRIDTFKIPDDVSFEEATLIEPTACCLRAQNKLGIESGDTVCVIGAGPSGILHVLLSRMAGAVMVAISDLVEYRLKMAERFGADLVINPRLTSVVDAVMGETDGRGADVVIVTAPHQGAFVDAVKVCRRGGVVCLFAPTPPGEYARISPHRLFFSEIRVVPSYSTSHVETRMALRLIKSGRIPAKDLITHCFPLSRVGEAFQMAAKTKECLKVVVVNR
jgi:L-iditol 2-dehydrogenase